MCYKNKPVTNRICWKRKHGFAKRMGDRPLSGGRSTKLRRASLDGEEHSGEQRWVHICGEVRFCDQFESISAHFFSKNGKGRVQEKHKKLTNVSLYVCMSAENSEMFLFMFFFPESQNFCNFAKSFLAWNLHFAELGGWGTTFDIRKAEISETH